MGYQDRYVNLALDYLSKMKIAVMVRQLDLGHILWCGRVVRVQRAHRVRVVRSVQKMLDVGRCHSALSCSRPPIGLVLDVDQKLDGLLY